MSPSEDVWVADWPGVEAAQRRVWLRVSADERLRWLEEALTFACEVGALDRDRRRRSAAAERSVEEADRA